MHIPHSPEGAVPAAQAEPHRGREAALFGLAALLLSLAIHWPMLMGRVPFPADVVLGFPPWESIRLPEDFAAKHAEMGDVAVQVWPFRVLLVRAIAEGTLPLWNPSLLMGAPLAANAQTAAFYPFTLLYPLLPFALAWSLVALARTAAAFWLAALAARALGCSPAGAVVAASAYATCGFLTAWEGWTSSDAAVWLPAAVLATERIFSRGGPRAVATAAAAFALPVLAGHPEVAVYVAGAGAAFFAWRIATTGGTGRFRSLLLFAAACLLAVGLSAVQIAPTLEWVSLTAREPNAGKSFPPRPVTEAVSFFSRDLTSHPSPLGVHIPEGAAYAGLVTLFLLPFAFRGRRRSNALFFALALAFSFAAIYGLPPVKQLLDLMPIVRHFPNNRLILLADFSIALLAGLGLTALSARRPESWPARERAWTLAAALAVPTAGVAWTFFRLASSGDASLRAGGTSLLWAAAILAALWTLAALRGAGRLEHGAFTLGLLGLSVVDGASFASGHVPYPKPGRIWPEPPLVRQLRTGGPEPFRVVAVDGSVPINAEAVYGLESPAGYDFVLARVREFLLPMTKSDDSFLLSPFDAGSVVALRDRRLDMANVRFVVATTWNRSADLLAAESDRFREVYREGRIVVFENLRCLPRALLVPRAGVRAVGGRAEALAAVSSPTFDPEREAVVEGELPAEGPATAGAPVVPTVRFRSRRSDATDLQVDVPTRSLLVLAETAYPGWRAFVDGVEVPVVTANHVFRGVWLEPGRRSVVFRYAPTFLFVCGVLSLGSLAVVVALLVIPRRARANGPGPAAP